MTDFPQSLFMVGCGNMAGAMLMRWLDCGLDPARVTVLRPSGRPVAEGVTVISSPPATLPRGTHILLGMKPHQLSDVAAQVASIAVDAPVVISILAGVTLSGLRAASGPRRGAASRTAARGTAPGCPAPARQLGDRDGRGVAVAVQLHQRAQRVRGLGRDRDHRRPRSYADLRSSESTGPRAGASRWAGQIQPRSVAISTAWARSIAPSLP